MLAGYLASVGGFVNSAGFVLVGSFTSHVTGNVGRLANDLSAGSWAAAVLAAAMVVAFFSGAVGASMMIESRFTGRGARAYGNVLAVEAALLAAFTLIARLSSATHPILLDTQASILCLAMGMQNALVSRLSGAVVRTTHLTGVVTDLGIEFARWFRYWRGSVSARTGVPLVLGQNQPERPPVPKSLLLLTIFSAFSTGAVLGALAATRLHHAAMLLPVLALCLGVMQARRVRKGR